MGRTPCCDKANVKKGPWSPEEDAKLKAYIEEHGTGGNWIALPQKIGLRRCGKSCRLRWLNYLRPNIKHGGFSEEEDNIICSLYISIGSRWSIIAAQLPGRTDNDIKNYWNTRLKKKLLGKQRKEQQQSRRASIKQEINKRGNENLMVPSIIIDQQHTPYSWTGLPATVMNQTAHFMDQESFKNMLIKLEGGFSDDLHQPSNISPDIYQNQLHVNSSAESTCNYSQLGSTNYTYSVNEAGPHVFDDQGLDSFQVGLDQLAYSDRKQQLEAMESLYGIIDMANGSTGASSVQSTSWGNTNSLPNYDPQLVSDHYETCLQSLPQDSSFGDPLYFSPQ